MSKKVRITESKLKKIVREIAREELAEASARYGTGGRREAEGELRVYRVDNPTGREPLDLAVDVALDTPDPRSEEDIDVLRVLGYSTGRPVKGLGPAIDNIKKQILRGKADRIDTEPGIEPMVQN